MADQSAPATPDLATQLRSRGLRVTPQREQVLQAVHRLGHATPEQIGEAVPTADLTTVYRTLELLEELGFVRHTHLGHGAPAYRPAEDEHVHVVCHSCGQVSDVAPGLIDQLSAQLRDELDFTVDRAHFTVFGRCSECAGQEVSPEQISSRPSLHQHGH